VIDIQMELYKTAPYLEFLPLPKRIEGYEMWKEGVERVKANDVVPRAPGLRPRFVDLLFLVCSRMKLLLMFFVGFRLDGQRKILHIYRILPETACNDDCINGVRDREESWRKHLYCII
jgi:hypothetical protein